MKAKNLATLMSRELRDDVRGRAESVETEPRTLTHHHEKSTYSSGVPR